MDPVLLFLITVAAIFLIGVIGEIVFERTGVPDVIWLMLVGIVLGPVTGLVDRAMLSRIAPFFGAITLVIVLFDGGSGLRLKELGHAMGRGIVVALLTFLLSVAMLAGASMVAADLGLMPEEWSWLHGIIMGAILGGPSSVVIMPALARSSIDPRISSVINLESALTDVLCVVVTAASIRVAVSGATDLGGVAATIGKAFGIGLGVGAAVGFLALLALRKLIRNRHAYPLILGTLLLLFVTVDWLGGSAALAILTAAVIVGNAPALAKVVGLSRGSRLSRGVESTHDQITFIVKSFFFTFIGAMLGPPWHLVVIGVVMGFLLLVARAPAIGVATLGTGWPKTGKILTAVTMPRGMAAGVLAMLPAQAGIAGTEQLPVMVFAAVLTTVVFFAVGFPILKNRAGVPVIVHDDAVSPPAEMPPVEIEVEIGENGEDTPPPR